MQIFETLKVYIKIRPKRQPANRMTNDSVINQILPNASTVATLTTLNLTYVHEKPGRPLLFGSMGFTVSHFQHFLNIRDN